MSKENTEFRLASRDCVREAARDPMENACATVTNIFGRRQSDPGQELARLARLSDENPELSDSIRECELLCQALIAHSNISASLAGRISEESDAIGRGCLAL